MAKRNPAIPPALSPIPVENIPRDPATLAKIGEQTVNAFAEYEQEVAADKAKAAIDKANQRRKRQVTKQDITTVNNALSGLVVTMMATGRLAYLGVGEVEAEDSEAILTVIRETVRRSARVMDACVTRLGGMAMGGFDDALDDED